MHRHAPANYQCPFCRAAAGVEDDVVYTKSGDIIHRDAQLCAFISSHQWPNNKGHVLIVPNQHYENIFELPAELGGAIFELSQKIARAMKSAYSCDGISTRQHNEPAGDQDVWHYHLHVFPRYNDDRLYFHQRVFMEAKERAEYAERLKRCL